MVSRMVQTVTVPIGMFMIRKMMPSELHYHDPVGEVGKSRREWMAAYAPVFLESRTSDAKVADTGWYVIVQQELVE